MAILQQCAGFKTSWQDYGKIVARSWHEHGKILQRSCKNLQDFLKDHGKILQEFLKDHQARSWQGVAGSCKDLARTCRIF